MRENTDCFELTVQVEISSSDDENPLLKTKVCFNK